MDLYMCHMTISKFIVMRIVVTWFTDKLDIMCDYVDIFSSYFVSCIIRHVSSIAWALHWEFIRQSCHEFYSWLTAVEQFHPSWSMTSHKGI
jgi:hypothetical protein